MEEDDMKRLWMVPILFGVAWLFYPSFSFADYIIHLNSGRKFVTDRYWEDGGEIKFNYSEGVLGFSKDLILSIEEQETDSEGEKPEPAVEEPAAQQAAEKKVKKEKVEKGETEKNLQAFIEQKKILKKQLDDAMCRVREASKNRDKAAKKKAREEMTAFSKQLFDLTEKVKGVNNGQLPDGW
jgi:hypothetical protein